ncbi:MAG TPA: T9SS type A sorting domain-containing protein [Paludibacter sp.]|nr:T9SS type A sorting domain-containing protein [Paludibacter sp.]
MKNIIAFKISFLLTFCLFLTSFPLTAQRKMEKLDRGVVAVRNNSSAYFVSWRYLASDPEDIQFNLYAKKTGGSFTKINTTPLKVPNYQTTTTAVNNGTQLYVTSVINGTEGTPSQIFTINAAGFNAYRSAYLDFTYNPANDGLDISKYSTKFVWPADIDGDGEYDFVVDRLSVDGGSHKVQAYLRNGTLLWTIDMGPNVSICEGQDDMVIAYDMDCDGKAEVVVKSSDGTVFSNGKGVNGSSTLDTDNDGIVNYSAQNVKNPPQYITVIDGTTGIEKNSIEMKYPSNYTRTNKAIFMGTEYANLNGYMSILYLDGKHPSVGFMYKTRTSSDQYHWYYASAYGYNASGQWINHYNWERGYLNAAEFHSIRAADVDLDGRDEFLNGGFGLKYDGSLAFNAQINHGDRFRTGDIDPERPGLETFAIQQNATNMLGMLTYDAATGSAIKKFFMSGVGDVGRGECMDVDSTRLGYEMWSTMANMYDARGNVVFEGATPFPNEGVWWDGDLAREELTSADGNGFNADIRKYDMNTHDFGNRLIEFAKMTNWQVKSEYGRRPAFFGDIAGDWREEVVLEKKGVATDGTTETCPGFVAFSTDYPTNIRLYCLMQNPAYRMQATTKGYYQSAFPDYYLGYKMPTPPIPPVQRVKLTWISGTAFDKTSSNFLLDDEKSTAAFVDGDDIMFDISGSNSSAIQMNSDLAPSKLWAMNPKGKDYVLSGTGKLTGTMDLVKSMNGNFTLNGNHTYTGKTLISEGVLTVNGSLSSPVDIRAKGTLAGNAILNGGIILNPGLNLEGGRLSPGNGLVAAKLGKMTINSNVAMKGKSNIEFDIIPSSTYKNDSLVINGDFTVSGINNIIIKTLSGTLPAGIFSLIKWSGNFTGNLNNFNIEGISGIPVSLMIENNTLKLVVNAVRSVAKVNWTGAESGNWDFVSGNFKLSDQPTYFVTGDSVIVNDDAIAKTITLTDNFSPSNILFENGVSPIILKGTGGISGTGNLVKTGRGLLNIETISNLYTGKTLFTNAVVQVASLSDAGFAGSLGSAAVAPANFVMNSSKLIVNATATNTNRGITLQGNDTINVLKSNGVVSIGGVLTGSGKLIKNGPGQLNISGSVANTFSGGTVISGGTIGLGTFTMNNSGLGNGNITFENGGKLSMYYSTDYGQSPNWNLTIPSNHTGNLVASGRCAINGSISGAGTLNFTVPYVRADLVAGGASFTGKLNVINGSGSFRITTNSIGFPQANIHLSNVVDMGAYSAIGASGTNTGTVVKIGSLSGVVGSTVSGGTWQIGTDNRDAIFNGVLNAGATVTKYGTGNWTLTAANLITSAFNINGGKVTVTNTTGSATGTSSVYVNNTATLAGTGTVSGSVVVNSGATIAPGNNGIGTLKIGGNLVLQTNSKTSIEVTGTLNDKLIITGSVILKGILEMTDKGAAYQAGSTFTIFTAASASGVFDAISPEKPAEGLKWNTSRITEGVITVDVADGIEDIHGASLRVWPVPVKDNCYVSIGAFAGDVKVELMNQIGVIISSEIVNSSQVNHMINTNSLPSGFYFVKVSDNNNKSFLRKIIKQ